jgi:hypothetical protein
VRPLLLGQQRFDVRRVVDPAVAIVGAAVLSDLASAVEHAQGGLGRDQGQGAADGAGRDRVVVEIEADVDRLCRADGDDEIGLEGMERKSCPAMFSTRETLAARNLVSPVFLQAAPASLVQATTVVL